MPEYPLTDPTLPADLQFLAGGGAATRLILARDWAAHPLGPPGQWPVALKTALSLVLNSPESMILNWDRDELHFFFNEAYFPMLGPRLDWAMGARFDEVWADGWEQARPIIADAFAGRSRRFVDLPWKLDTDRGATDTWWTFSYSRVLDQAGAVAGLFVFTNETTHRVLADQALATSQDELRALNATLGYQIEKRTAERDRMWNSSPDLMAVLDADGKFLAVNPAWTDILGYRPEDVVGLTPDHFIHPDDVEATARAHVSACSDTISDFENRYRHRDDGYRWIQWSAAPGDGEVFAVGRHVTAAKEAEILLRHTTEQLNQAQKMDAIGQLTGGLAHDFNNLLTIIRGSVELLRRPDLAPARRDRYIDAISDTADRAAKLTGQLLAFARRQALTPELIDVGATVAGVTDMVRALAGSHIELRLDLAPQACLARVDRSQLETAIVNMAINGRDAMNGRGRLHIAVAAVPGIPTLRSHGAVAGDFVAVTVTDHGVGIAPEDIERVFEPFFTTKGVGKGTGLGLSQVIGFAKQTGGDVEVESVPGAGTTFTLYLPRATEGSAVAAPAAADRAASHGDGHCILLVEDNTDVGRFATEALAELGYDSVHATSGADALRALHEGAARFDAIFSDVVMPGMDGVELARAVNAGWPQLPVLLTSGYSHVLAEDAQHGFELLHKPYSVEELSRALHKAIGAARRPQDGAAAIG